MNKGKKVGENIWNEVYDLKRQAYIKIENGIDEDIEMKLWKSLDKSFYYINEFNNEGI